MRLFEKSKKIEPITRKVLIEKHNLDGGNVYESIRQDLARIIIPKLIIEMRSAGISKVYLDWSGSERWDIERLEKLIKGFINNPNTRLPVDSHRDADCLVTFAHDAITRISETKDNAEKFKNEAKKIREEARKLQV